MKRKSIISVIILLLGSASCSTYPDIECREHMEKHTGLVFSKDKFSDSITALHATISPGDILGDSMTFDKALDAARSYFGTKEKMVSEGLQPYYCFDKDRKHGILWASENADGGITYTLLFSEYPIHELKSNTKN